MDAKLPLADELAAVSLRMSGLLLSRETVGSVLDLITSLARDTVAGSTGSGTTLIDPDGSRTSAAATDPLVEAADGLQYESGEGPCLTAWARCTTIRVDDLDDPAVAARWPRWTEAARPLGVAAVLSAPLVAGGEALGAMKVYADRPNTFGPHDEHLMERFAAQAAILLANVRTVEQAQRLSTDLVDTMRTRDVVNIAKGMVMAEDGVGEDAAFTALARSARHQQRPLGDLARSLVEAERA